MATKQIRPTKLELSILNVLWQKGPATVREIHAIVIRRLGEGDGDACAFHPEAVPKDSEGDGKASRRV
jgi:hypothetical protein